MSRNGCAVVVRRLKQTTGASSDADLAKILDVSPQTLSSWKSRDRVPYALCVDLALREGVSLDWLLLGEGDPLRATSLSMPDPDENGRARLVDRLLALTPSDLQTVALIVEDKHRIRHLEQCLAELKNASAVSG